MADTRQRLNKKFKNNTENASKTRKGGANTAQMKVR